MDAISPIVCTDMRMFLNNIIKGNLLLLQWHLPRTSNKKKKKISSSKGAKSLFQEIKSIKNTFIQGAQFKILRAF